MDTLTELEKKLFYYSLDDNGQNRPISTIKENAKQRAAEIIDIVKQNIHSKEYKPVEVEDFGYGC